MNRLRKKYLEGNTISSLRKQVNPLIVTALLGMFSTGNIYAAPSFPNFPLSSGAGSKVPHNVMLILDDSGSMEWSFMPSIDLMTNYNEWVSPQSQGVKVITWLCYASDSKNYTTRQTANGVWYWSNEGNRGVGTACDNPSQYLEGTWDELKRFDNGIARSYYNNAIYYNPAKTYLPWRTKAPLPDDPTQAPERLANADPTKVSNHASYLTGELDLRNSPHAVFFVPNQSSGYWKRMDHANYYKYRVGTNSNGDAIIQRCNVADTSQCTGNSTNWVEDTPTMLDKNRRPLLAHTQRSQREELQNFANWFHYHSTRMKMAKAGASEAFGTLNGEEIRVGYDAINSGSIIYPIPHNVSGGMFKDSNRSDFYDRLQAQTATGNTPLRAALERTGEYYKTADPYKDSKGVELSCRRNYAVLVTDGAWTQDSSRFSSLNLVAHHYWSQDLRPTIKDNVPPSGNDYADWQHMNTFGISVGMAREYNQTNTPDAQYSSYIWKNNVSKNDSRFEYHRNYSPFAKAYASSPDIYKIEDLAWAAGEGYGRYFMANDTEEFAKALIDSFSDMRGSKSSSGVAISSSTLDTNTRTFRASFTAGKWSGDLVSTNLSGTGGQDWTLSQTFETGKSNATDFTSRIVLRGSGGGSSGAALFDDSFLSGAKLARTSGTDSVSIEDNIKWLRGEEINNLRGRSPHPIGDIVHSTPVYSNNTNTVYVGANDGMLHGVNATDGKVLFSYIPGGVDLEALATLSSPKYEHRFFVDGSIDIISKAHHGARTLLLAAMGRGGRGVFSLDVTDPKNMESSQVLWDDTVPNSNTSYLPDMGYVLGRVHLRRANGSGRKTVALIPNGIDSPNGCAALIVREIKGDGSAEKPVTLNTGACGNNGLMALALADLDHNGTVDLVYGGDLKGNVWRWDFRKNIPDGSASSQPAKLFSGDVSRPITGGLVVSGAMGGRVFVGFGTGRYISLSDVPKEGALGPAQRLYGIIDHGVDNTAVTLTDSDLTERGLHKNGNDRAFDPYEELPVDSEGWYVKLDPPERVIYPPNIAGKAMYITTAIPDASGSVTGDTCDSVSSGGYVYAINLFTGTSPDKTDPYFRGKGTTIVNGKEVPIGGIPNGSIPTGVELLVGKNGEIEVLYDAGDTSLKSEHGAILPDIDPAKKGRLSWREILRF